VDVLISRRLANLATRHCGVVISHTGRASVIIVDVLIGCRLANLATRHRDVVISHTGGSIVVWRSRFADLSTLEIRFWVPIQRVIVVVSVPGYVRPVIVTVVVNLFASLWGEHRMAVRGVVPTSVDFCGCWGSCRGCNRW
jgi:hypothetical protein